MRSRVHLVAIALLAVAAACGGSGGSDATTGPTTGGNTGGNTGGTSGRVSTNQVTVSNNLFQPADIQVAVGTTVTWTWSDASVTHNVTFADGSGSGDKPAGSTFQKTFSTAGTFTYKCTIHAGMNGSVLVQ